MPSDDRSALNDTNDPAAVMRSLADRLEAVRRTLPAVASAGHHSETAWPMTHLVGIAAEASDAYLFRVADPAADRAVLAAFAAATSRSGQAVAALADTTSLLLDPRGLPAEVEHSVARADGFAALAARDLNAAADRLSASFPASVVPLRTDDLKRRRGAQSSAATARSRIVSAQPSAGDQPEPSAPTAPVIPLHRSR
ncbi:hypothetical protein AB0D22_07725 [Kitasatospora sp. NPDC048538]|uniref:hypothetical protein n=1 Tax=Kitasatospora sp. NPDC048538 TaxID=3155633 RepID=UPI003408CD7C